MQTMNENHATEMEKLQIQLDDANQKLYKLQQQQIQQQLQQLRLDNEKVDEKSEIEVGLYLAIKLATIKF